MGVPGLSTLIKRNKFMTRVFLHSSKVVVDGKNLRSFLYESSGGMNTCFGGDYQNFEITVTKFFKHLFSARVTPLVVLDGGFSKKGEEVKKRYRRYKERTQKLLNADLIWTKENKNKCAPMFLTEVMKEVLEDLNVEIIQSSFDADHTIAQLALKEDCPVLSNDSDFAVFPVKFITLNSMSYLLNAANRPDQNSFLAIKSESFDRGKLLNHYNISLPAFQLASTLALGNDYLPVGTLDRFVRNEEAKGREPTYSGAFGDLGKILHFSSKRIPEQMLDAVLACTTEDKRPAVRQCVEELWSKYRCRSCNHGEEIAEEFSSYGGSSFPAWFVKDFHSAKIPCGILDIAVNRKFLLTTQVEMKDRDSAHAGSRAIHQVLVDILTSLDRNVAEPVQLVTRIGSDTGKLPPIQPQELPKDFRLRAVRRLDIEVRRQLLIRTLAPRILGEERLAGLGEELLAVVLVLECWSQHSRQEPVTQVQLLSVILLFFIRTKLDPRTGAVRSTRVLKNLALLKKFSSWKYYKSSIIVSGLFKRDEDLVTTAEKFDVETVHNISELQAVLSASKCLNALLGGILKFPKISELIHGTFLYNSMKNGNLIFDIGSHFPGEVGGMYREMVQDVMGCLTATSGSFSSSGNLSLLLSPTGSVDSGYSTA